MHNAQWHFKTIFPNSLLSDEFASSLYLTDPRINGGKKPSGVASALSGTRESHALLGLLTD